MNDASLHKLFFDQFHIKNRAWMHWHALNTNEIQEALPWAQLGGLPK
jgi:hypothetical protein